MTGRPLLLGREPALAALRAALAGAARGQGALVLVTGEPGIGKTALLGAFAGTAGPATVLWGQCWEGDGAPAFWPWVQVLRAASAAGAELGAAAGLLPDPAGATGPADPDRFALFVAVVDCLAGLATERPVLVILDDLQWADEGSLRLLEFTARHLAARRVLLLGAYREVEAGDSLRRLAATGASHLPLSGLSQEEVGALMASLGALGADPSPASPAAASMWQRTGGNPLLVGELARLLAAQRRPTDATAAAAMPASVREILQRRLARLSQPCADLLAVAAVMGPEVRLAGLAQVAGSTETWDRLTSLLDEAVAARVVQPPAGNPAVYRFAHDLYRETILAALPSRRRRELHLAVGRALAAANEEGLAVHPAELAAHFAAAGPAGAEPARRYGVIAGDEAASRSAYEEAAAHYERALTATALAGPRLDLLLRLGQVCNRAGDANAALRAFEEAAALARRAGDGVGLARAAVATHELGWRISHATSIALLREAIGSLPAAPTRLRSRAQAALARDLRHSLVERDWAAAEALAERAVAEAAGLGDPATLAFCLLARHDTVWRPGTAPARVRLLDDLLTAANAAGDRDLVAAGRLLRATALIEQGDAHGVSELALYCRLAGELGHARGRYGACSRRATLALLAGDLGQARELAGRARELGLEIGEPDTGGVDAILRWALDRLDGSWEVADLAADPWPQLPLIEAIRLISAGDLDAAGRVLAPVRPAATGAAHDLELAALLAEAVAAVGSEHQRAELYALLRPLSGSHVVAGACASYLGTVDHYLGLLARSRGRLAEAQSHFAAAAGREEGLGAVAWAAYSRAEAGRPGGATAEAQLRRAGDVWILVYRGKQSHLPDAKGLRDLTTLLASPGQPVRAFQLYTGQPVAAGADPVLDEAAKVAYRRRLDQLAADIDEASQWQDLARASAARAERDALVAQLSAAVGLGGRDRRLGAEQERARKAVTARIRDTINRIGRADAELARHLAGSIRTGTWCVYEPAEPIRWRV